MKPQLHAYLGINEQGDLALYVSTGRLNPVGTRVEKGIPLPSSVLEFARTQWDEDDDRTTALCDLQDYFNDQVKEKKRR